MSKIAVVGAGAWGTALALHAERAGHKVTLVARDAKAASWIDAKR
jgi:glycerol-3-phosphate dehydrogenase (NAD(P)+)